MSELSSSSPALGAEHGTPKPAPEQGLDAVMNGCWIDLVSLAMARTEGNEDAQQRAILNNFDALGYTALAKAAVDELQRLGLLRQTSTASAASEAATA